MRKIKSGNLEKLPQFATNRSLQDTERTHISEKIERIKERLQINNTNSDNLKSNAIKKETTQRKLPFPNDFFTSGGKKKRLYPGNSINNIKIKEADPVIKNEPTLKLVILDSTKDLTENDNTQTPKFGNRLPDFPTNENSQQSRMLNKYTLASLKCQRNAFQPTGFLPKLTAIEHTIKKAVNMSDQEINKEKINMLLKRNTELPLPGCSCFISPPESIIHDINALHLKETNQMSNLNLLSPKSKSNSGPLASIETRQNTSCTYRAQENLKNIVKSALFSPNIAKLLPVSRNGIPPSETTVKVKIPKELNNSNHYANNNQEDILPDSTFSRNTIDINKEKIKRENSSSSNFHKEMLNKNKIKEKKTNSLKILNPRITFKALEAKNYKVTSKFFDTKFVVKREEIMDSKFGEEKPKAFQMEFSDLVGENLK